MNKIKIELIQQAGFVKEASAVYLKWDTSVTNTGVNNIGSMVSGVVPSYFPAPAKNKLKVPVRRNSFGDGYGKPHSGVVLGDRIAFKWAESTLAISRARSTVFPFYVIGDVGVMKEDLAGESRRVLVPQTTYLDSSER
ncbi:hypothetical protein O9993_02950 [Vibrio lentus]|nr:hypothetical protein [Vibrio lentus]